MSFWDIFKRKKKEVIDPWLDGFAQDDKCNCDTWVCKHTKRKESVRNTTNTITKSDSDDDILVDPLLTGIIVGEILSTNDEKPLPPELEDNVEFLEDIAENKSDFGGGESGGAGAGESYDSSDNDSSNDSSSDSSDSSSSGD